MSEREAIVSILDDELTVAWEHEICDQEKAADRIVAELVEPLRKDRDEWRQANLGIVRKCAEVESRVSALEALLDKARRDAIEECAKLVQTEPYRAMNDRDNLAAAIRALIDKEPA